MGARRKFPDMVGSRIGGEIPEESDWAMHPRCGESGGWIGIMRIPAVHSPGSGGVCVLQPALLLLLYLRSSPGKAMKAARRTDSYDVR